MKTPAKNTAKPLQAEQLVVMGRIVAPYGILGWLKVQPDTETLDSLFDYPDWWLGRGEVWQAYSVETVKIHGNTLLVKLDGIDDRDAAFACKSKQVAVPRAQLPKPDENEYYWSDLIGMQVHNLQDVDFGQVVDVFETGANDVLVIKSSAAGSKERLIPFIDQVVLEVDAAKRSIVLDWPLEWDNE